MGGVNNSNNFAPKAPQGAMKTVIAKRPTMDHNGRESPKLATNQFINIYERIHHNHHSNTTSLVILNFSPMPPYFSHQSSSNIENFFKVAINHFARF